MSAGTGVEMRETRFKGRVYVEIPAGDVLEGDVVSYEFRGKRTHFVKTGPSKKGLVTVELWAHEKESTRKVHLRDIREAWRRRASVQPPSVPGDEGKEEIDTYPVEKNSGSGEESP